jgi:hypothetical protein
VAKPGFPRAATRRAVVAEAHVVELDARITDLNADVEALDGDLTTAQAEADRQRARANAAESSDAERRRACSTALDDLSDHWGNFASELANWQMWTALGVYVPKPSTGVPIDLQRSMGSCLAA